MKRSLRVIVSLIGWVGNALTAWTLGTVLITGGLVAVAWFLGSDTRLRWVVTAPSLVVILWLAGNSLHQHFDNQYRADGVKLSGRFHLLPIPWGAFSDELRDRSPGDDWNSRPALAIVELSVKRATGLRDCYLTVRGDSAIAPATRQMLVKGFIGGLSSPHARHSEDAPFSARLRVGDVPTRFARSYCFLVDAQLPTERLGIAWTLEHADGVLNGAVPLTGARRWWPTEGVWPR